MKQKRNISAGRKRGFSIMEAVIAMAIVVIISISVISLQVGMVQGEKILTQKTAIIRYAEDALDCFNWSQNESDFKQAIEELGFQQLDGIYIIEHHLYRIEIQSEFDTDPKTLEFTAVDQDGEEIYGFKYEK